MTAQPLVKVGTTLELLSLTFDRQCDEFAIRFEFQNAEKINASRAGHTRKSFIHSFILAIAIEVSVLNSYAVNPRQSLRRTFLFKALQSRVNLDVSRP